MRGAQRARPIRTGWRGAQGRISQSHIVIEPAVDPVEMKEVFAFDVEDQSLGVDSCLAKDSTGEKGMEQKRCIAGLRCHP